MSLRAALVLLLPLLIGQNLFIAVRGVEPYPAMMMPAFTYGGYREDHLEIEHPEVVLIDNEREHTVSLGELLAPLPASHRRRIAALSLRPGSPIHPSLPGWLGRRAAALRPGRQISRVEIRWFRDRFRFDPEPSRLDRRALGRLIVPLTVPDEEP